MIRILIVDHDKNLREFIAENLTQQHGQLIVDQAASGNEAIQRMIAGEKFLFHHFGLQHARRWRPGPSKVSCANRGSKPFSIF